MRRIALLFVVSMILAVCCLWQEPTQKQSRWESFLIKKEEKKETRTIRVLIKTDSFLDIAHDKVHVSSEHGLVIHTRENSWNVPGGEVFTLEKTSSHFDEGSVCVEPSKSEDSISLLQLHRNCGTPAYEGKLELYAAEDGIVIVNELEVEAYLEQVVPSEMPSSYETEALKAQALCARSYAYRQMESIAYPEYEAHVDDSTSFQVYANAGKHEITSKVVQETKGEVVQYGNQIATTYFYSTSCGNTAAISAWGVDHAEKYPYLKSVSVADENACDYEKELPWYRWEIELGKEEVTASIESYSGTNLGELDSIIVRERGDGKIVQSLEVVGNKDTVVIETENKIRSALASEGALIKKQDGSESICTKLLPSAFFTISDKADVVRIEGGGFGHGIGLSQNGANEMAKKGMDYKSIIEFFYPGTKIVAR